MIFKYTGKRSKGGLQNFYGKPDPEGEYYEDIFISYRLGNKWLEPEDIGFKLNTKGNDAAIALSPDGQQLFVYKEEKGGEDGVVRGELSAGHVWENGDSGGGWGGAV